jgi:hypothetical protein
VGHQEAGAPGAATATSLAQRRGELVPAPQPCPGRQHVGQAESRERPLARRAERMARPARVRIRRRNPWVLARRRVFGWKVRLLTCGLLNVPCRGGLTSRPRMRHRSSSARPLYGTGPCAERSNAPARRLRHPTITPPGCSLAGHHVRSRGRSGKKITAGLWTTGCWPARGVVSVTGVAGRAPIPAVSPVLMTDSADDPTPGHPVYTACG